MRAIVVLDGEMVGSFILWKVLGLVMSLVEVFDELWGEEVSFGDPLVV